MLKEVSKLSIVLGFAMSACGAPSSDVSNTSVVRVCAAPEFARFKWQPASVLDDATLPAGTRIIRPDMLVTTDYVETRLNIRIGRQGRIEQVYCG